MGPYVRINFKLINYDIRYYGSHGFIISSDKVYSNYIGNRCTKWSKVKETLGIDSITLTTEKGFLNCKINPPTKGVGQLNTD